MIAAAVLTASLHLLPRPQSLTSGECSRPFAFARPLRVPPGFDPAALEEIDERWKALGIPALSVRPGGADVRVSRGGVPQSYRLQTLPGGSVAITAGDAAGAFYAAMTLAQLPVRSGDGWELPCVTISDRPAMTWRVLMDDVSRGPLPAMEYFKRRIRTIAAFKMNGYSPMMENVFVDPRNPLPAPLDGITPAQLSELDRYARRFHVALIPAQQTFAHMHNTLAVEKYAGAADLPHGFFMRPDSNVTQAYLHDVITDELRAVPNPPFFHIMSDEASAAPAVFAAHVAAMEALVKPSGASLMLWDDAMQQYPALLTQIPRDAVVTTYHYEVEPSYAHYLTPIANAGFRQMASPSAHNYNEIFPDLASAIANERGMIRDGKAAHVLGLFETVWHDDGQTLFEQTWYPVLYAASDAWENGDLEPARFAEDFPRVFFGTSDAQYARDIQDLADAQQQVAGSEYAGSDYYLWADPFDARIASRLQADKLRQIRLDSEDAEQHLLGNTPPLNAQTAQAMYLAARMFDTLGRKYQAAAEVRKYYGDAAALAAAGKPAERDLYWSKYWFWELRDDFEALAPLYARAWSAENRPGHLASNLEYFHVEAQLDIVRAGRVNAATFEDYEREHRVPPLESILAP